MIPFPPLAKHMLALLAIAILTPSAQGGIHSLEDPTSAFQWISLDVGQGIQGDAHLLTDYSGKAVLIDAGHYSAGLHTLIPYLKSAKISRLDTVIITHPHYDHYGGVIALLETGFPIGQIYHYEPSFAACDEDTHACNVEDILRLRALAEERNVPLLPLDSFQRIDWPDGPSLTRIFHIPLEQAPPGFGLNDTSLVAKLNAFGTKVLFTGDLDQRAGEWILAQQHSDVKANILKVPHHGSESTVSDEFFHAVGAETFVVSAHQKLWCCKHEKRVRSLLEKLSGTRYVNGFNGHVTVHFLKSGSYYVTTEKEDEGGIQCEKDPN